MEPSPQLNEIFRQIALVKRREALALVEDEREFDDRRRKDRHEEEAAEKFRDATLAATQEQCAAFRDRLDGYDTAIVRALMDNEQALEEARKRREALEESAYRLPDGRRVFKSQDGKHVFDQDGEEVPRSIVDPDSISDTQPRWETFKKAAEEEQRLRKERDELHEYQRRVDNARDAVDKDGVTAKELDDLGADLQRDMPEAVRERLAGTAPAQNADGPQTPGPIQTVRVPNGMGQLGR